MTMNEQAYQDQMEDDAQFEAEQQALKDDVYDKLADCYSTVREMINNELNTDKSDTDWQKIEGISIAMYDLEYYLATDDWTNALVEINNYV